MDHLVKELECLKCTWALSHHVWTPALALTDKSEWRLTTVTCSTVTSYLGERSAASSNGEASRPQIHINAHYGCWCKNVCSVLAAIRKTRSKPETETPMMSSGEESPLSFPLAVGAGRMREEGWGGPLVHQTHHNLSPGMFRAELSSDITRRSSGTSSLLHQWAKVGQQKSALVSSSCTTSERLCELEAGLSMTEYRTVGF